MFKWTDELNTGIDVIDVQHRRIVDYINDLDACIVADNMVKVGDVLEDLVDYTLAHFSYEEELMVSSDYPLSSTHRMVHDAFRDRVAANQEKFNAADQTTRRQIAKKLLSELTIWLTNHIQRDDKDYVKHVLPHLGTKKDSLSSRFFKLFGK